MGISQIQTEKFNDEELIPRFVCVGEITFDLFHRDGRIGGKCLNLHPKEFELLWRLAREPGVAISKPKLHLDVWRVSFDPQSNTLAVHVARIRQKLRPFGLAYMLATDREIGYF